jgi:hypothetical protein
MINSSMYIASKTSCRPSSRRHMHCVWIYALMLIASTGVAFAQEPDLSGTWLLDTIQLKNGQTLEGLMLADDAPGDFEFAEVRRPAGKPMYVVIRPIERRDILRIDPLSADDRSATRQRLRNFVRRASIEARQIDQVRLKPSEQSDNEGWQFRGDWFSLDSSASEPTTRQAAVRMEQMFAAYRQLLPPLRTPRERQALWLDRRVFSVFARLWFGDCQPRLFCRRL